MPDAGPASPGHSSPPAAPRPDRRAFQDWALSLALVAAVAVVYAAVTGQAFVNFDDGRYVYQNARVRAGLSWHGVGWALTTFHCANWHPLTWLSYMLDAQLFGVSAPAHKLVNVAFHAANAVLVFALLKLATGSRWRSALAAALFALHPLRVESVAWVSERKDVLSTFFWLLALIAWVRYARAPSMRRYGAVALPFALGLLAKPMVVTLPLTLLLIDCWPLRRIDPSRIFRAEGWALVREKLPLLVLSAVASGSTLAAQRAGGAVSSSEAVDLGARLVNAAQSAAAYLAKAVWPTDLAVIYPHPALVGGFSAWKVAASVGVLAAITCVAAWQRTRRPWVAFGWGWFLVTLLPVLGMVQVGLQGMADRYTYVPLVGPAVAVAWLAGELADRGTAPRAIAVAFSVVGLLALAVATRRQVAVWRDSFTLFRHALEVTGPENPLALRNLGIAHQDAGRPDLALPLLSESVRLGPYDAHAWMNLGIAYASLGAAEEGAACLRKAAAMAPGDPPVWFNLGIAAALQGRWDEAAAAEARLRALGSDLADRLAERARARRGP